MRYAWVVAAMSIVGTTAVQAEVRTAPSINQRDFGALPGAPGSSSYSPLHALQGPDTGSVGTFPTDPNAINPTTGLPLSSSSDIPIPSLDSVMPGASSSGLLTPP
jgi:hypothetical protein